MSKTATLAVTVGLSGDGFSGAPLYASSSSNTSANPPTTVAAGAAGPQTVAVPATAQGFAIVAPPNSTVTKTLKGVGGDTGLTLHPTLPTVLSLTPGSLASFVINFSAAETLSVVWL